MTNPGVPPPDRPAQGRGPVQLQISRQAHNDLTRIKATVSDQLGRAVTYAEVVERLIDRWDNNILPPIDDLRPVRDVMERETKRPLSDREIIGQLIDHWENT